MSDVFAGCLVERLPHPKAASKLPFFEFAPRLPLPTLATLARYKKQLKKPANIALVAPRSTWMTPRGAMRAGAEVDAGIDWLTRASDILGAFAIVLATGAELTTGERDQERLAAFAARLAPTGRKIIIAPRGLWEPEQAIPFALKTGTIYGFDPMEHDAPGGSFLYARVKPMGARPRLTQGALAQIGERIAVSGCEQAYVCVDSERSFADMKRLAIALTESFDTAALLPDDDEDEDAFEEDDEDEESGEEGDEDETDEDETDED